MPSGTCPTISRNRSKNAEEHLFTLKADFDATNEFLKGNESLTKFLDPLAI